jgi:hypothetical protein
LCYSKSATALDTGAKVLILISCGAESLKSASTGGVGERLLMEISSFTSSNEASDGITGANDENSNGAVTSSKFASVGVIGAKEIEVVLVFTEAPSLLAKRAFNERVKTMAMMMVEVFIFVLFDLMKQRYIDWAHWDRAFRLCAESTR